jgi:oligopeptide/dipeptide ABC transporter ATP-binding protein
MAGFAHRVGVMYAGRLIELAPVAGLFAQPRHPYTRALIESLPRFGRRGVFRGLPGVAPSLVSPPPGCAFHPRCSMAVARCAAEVPPLQPTGHDRVAACHFAGGDAPLAA